MAQKKNEPPNDAGTMHTCLSRVDGEAGELLIGGYAVEQLAGQVTYEEAVHLLWESALPNATQLAVLKQEMAARRWLSSETLAVLRAVTVQGAEPVDALRTGASALGLSRHVAPQDTASQDREDALTAVSSFPTLIAAYSRLRDGREPISPLPHLGHVANFLYMLAGEEPTAERAQALETYMVTVCDHGVSASTFAARVIISTGSDLISAVVGAVGALKGPLHGGAPGPVLEMLLGIGEADQAAGYLRAKLERGERLMGFGHRDYRVRDPRAVVLEAAAKRLFEHQGDGGLYALAKRVEGEALALLAEYKPGRRLNTNLEFWVAVLLHGVGLPPSLFTPIFAAARTAGWAAHCAEQRAVGRMIQPRTVYVGERGGGGSAVGEG